jgi:hypothetical protein
MAIVVTTTVTQQVVVSFEAVNGDDKYTDALYFTPAEFAALTNPQIRAQAVARYQAWKAVVTAVRPPPTPAEIQANIDNLQQMEDATQEQLLNAVTPAAGIALLQARATKIAARIAALQAMVQP